MDKLIWNIPIKTVSEANSSEHWTVSSKRHRSQQFLIRALFHSLHSPIQLPCKITLTRKNKRFLDEDDNLPMAFKWIKDEIALCIFPEKRTFYLNRKGRSVSIKGHGDNDPQIKWEYSQEKSQIPGIRIVIEPLIEIPV